MHSALLSSRIFWNIQSTPIILLDVWGSKTLETENLIETTHHWGTVQPLLKKKKKEMSKNIYTIKQSQ